MKKIILSVIAALFSFSVFAANEIDAIMLQNQGSLYVEKDGKMEWKVSVDAGTALSVLTEDVDGKKVPVTKESTRVVNKKDVKCTVYQVSYNGKEYWVLTDRISLNEKIAIVKKAAAVYRSPDIADVKNSSLPIGEIITFDSKYIANEKFEMYKISYFDEINYVTRNGYIMVSKISADKNDLKACKLIAQLKGTEDVTIQEELFNNINKLNISNEILSYAKAVKESLKPYDILDDGITSLNTYGYVVNPDTNSKINIRVSPSTKADVVTSFEDEVTSVYIVSCTNSKDTIGNAENYWYNIQSEDGEPLGWVFGEYIQY